MCVSILFILYRRKQQLHDSIKFLVFVIATVSVYWNSQNVMVEEFIISLYIATLLSPEKKLFYTQFPGLWVSIIFKRFSNTWKQENNYASYPCLKEHRCDIESVVICYIMTQENRTWMGMKLQVFKIWR